MFEISNRIKTAREAAGLSQEKLAEKIGVSRNAVAKWENGNSMPQIDKLASLSLSLGVSSDYLLGIKQEFSPGLKLSERAISALELFIKEIKGE